MSNEITVIKPNQSLVEDLETSGQKTIPFINILNSKSSKLSEEGYEYIIPFMNKICLVDNKRYSCLGASVDAVYLAVRSQASFYDTNKYDTVYSQVESGGDDEKYSKYRANARNFKKGYKFGPEYLLWVPSVNKIAKLFLGATKDREEAGKSIMELVNEEHYGLTIYTFKHQGGMTKYPRMIFKAKRNDDPDLLTQGPDKEEYDDALHQFLNPPVWSSEPEEGDDDR